MSVEAPVAADPQRVRRLELAFLLREFQRTQLAGGEQPPRRVQMVDLAEPKTINDVDGLRCRWDVSTSRRKCTGTTGCAPLVSS